MALSQSVIWSLDFSPRNSLLPFFLLLPEILTTVILEDLLLTEFLSGGQPNAFVWQSRCHG